MDIVESDGVLYVLGYGKGYYGYTTTLLMKIRYSDGFLLKAGIIKGSYGGLSR